MDYGTFVDRFNALRDRGFIPTLRKGATGVGYTLETLLQIKENKLSSPDVGWAEIKAHRFESSTQITLFTFDKHVWHISPLVMMRKYGNVCSNGKYGIYGTVGPKPNRAGLYLANDSENVYVMSVLGETLGIFRAHELLYRFRKKMPALLFVSAYSKKFNGVEHFHYFRAQFFRNPDSRQFVEMVRAGKVVLHLKFNYNHKLSRVRNFGTAFRILEKDLSLLFSEVQDI